MEQAAKKTFEIKNNVSQLSAGESVFLFSRDEEKALEDSAPWKNDPHYFTTVKISAVALIKMAIHARSGGQYEIMGVMYGRGTETRVNAGNEAMEYMVQFQDSNNRAGKMDLLRGWYHSHPGYGCWLSGIDVGTQFSYQQFQEPFVAVVIDPNRTVSAGKVEIGAFRTYPEGYVPPAAGASEYQSIPMDKIEDFGAHANAYYPLKVEIFKTKTDEKLLDLLWNKYWVATLSQSPILSNQEYSTSQIKDLNAKLNLAAGKLGESTGLKLKAAKDDAASKGKKRSYPGVEMEHSALRGPTKDGLQVAHEARNGMTAQIVKDKLFNQPLDRELAPEVAVAAAQGSR